METRVSDLQRLWTGDATAALRELSGGLAGTGHRPPRLGLDYSPASNERLTRFLRQWLAARPAPPYVVSGMAQGFDQALAHAAVLLNIPLVAAVPFPQQESKWPAPARARYDAIMARAARVVGVCADGYSPAKFIARDHWMVAAAAEVVSLWDGRPGGGTTQTVSHALTMERPVHDLWPAWAAFRGV
jgi:predicted Rossmann fold nucleotide-binding protein DprA/Smf involved in DNA uptake